MLQEDEAPCKLRGTIGKQLLKKIQQR